MNKLLAIRRSVRDCINSLDTLKKQFNNLNFILLILLNNNEKFVRIRSVVFKRR
jgi:hypothetical protein